MFIRKDVSPLYPFVQVYFGNSICNTLLVWTISLDPVKCDMLSSHPYTFDVGRLSSALSTFIKSLVAMWADIRSKRALVSTCLAS